MARKPTADPWPACIEAAAAVAPANQPEALFHAVERALGDVVGLRLFTVLAFDMQRGEKQRLYSNMPDAYSAGGRKPLRPNPWEGQTSGPFRPNVGRTKGDMWGGAADLALFESLNLGSAINLPVVYDGVLLGSVNLMHAENHYDDGDADLAAPFVALLTPALLQYLVGQGAD